ncbi:uncharacterized protein TRUGW13939_06623 [Talaromyces rugulosus]|uniref:CrcB-like protein-domain-containing protein n=1 Tax=Talaromyces rugulosus TaxID=121627 RepID=A0A7H8QZE6_TALRU|nr:uncharacterized protein TRUGW13939_06623 [Talaromyces rugulosus]QKX59489.1 hypothetical protein TRUGW13939_06623 [Talaromyces rugulosus]
MTLSISSHIPSSPSPPSSRTTSDGDQFLSETEKNLDEATAPPPILDLSEGNTRQQDYLENVRSSTSNRHSASRTAQPSVNDDEVQAEPHGQTSRTSKMLTKVTTYCYLILFAISGTLTRIVIEALTYYSGAPVSTPVLWANVGGSFIMGFLSEDQALFSIEVDHEDESVRRTHHTAHKKTIPLYIGLTTGFCGCLTSFSTFERDAFLALANNLPIPLGPYSSLSILSSTGAGQVPNGGFSFMAILAVIITEVCLSLAALKGGAHFALLTSSWLPQIPLTYLRRFIDPLVVFLAPASWVAPICLVALLPRSGGYSFSWDPETWRGPFLFSLVFAPVGCFMRFFLSLKLNRYFAQFPVGTFVSNLGGTMILGMAFSLQHAASGSSGLGGFSQIGCEVLQGIMDGFCGSMTTVSTWVLELSDLRRRHAYSYGLVSIVVPFAMLVIEIGPLRWTQGFASPVCYR